MNNIKSCINIVNQAVASRGIYSSDDVKIMKSCFKNVFDIVENESMISKQTVIEIIEFISFIRKIQIKCIGLQNEISLMFRSRLDTEFTEQDYNETISNDKLDRINEVMINRDEDTVPQFILHNTNIYTQQLKIILREGEVAPKSILSDIMSDYIFLERLYTLISCRKYVSDFYNKTRERLPEDIFSEISKIRRQYLLDKGFNVQSIKTLVDKVKNVVINKEYHRIPRILTISLFSILYGSKETFRFPLNIDDIEKLEFLTGQLIGVLKNYG